MMKTKVGEVVSTLWESGLTEALLTEAILRGEAARETATAFHPPSHAGFNAWSETVYALRDLLVLPHKWKESDVKNLSLVVSPCNRHAIAVVAGDAATGLGDPNRTPQPKHARGDATMFAVEASQLSLFNEEVTRRLRFGPTLWFLLVYRTGNAVRAELSIPEAINEKGFVTKWSYRHTLPVISLDPEPLAESTESEPSSGVLVEVTRKKS